MPEEDPQSPRYFNGVNLFQQQRLHRPYFIPGASHYGSFPPGGQFAQVNRFLAEPSISQSQSLNSSNPSSSSTTSTEATNNKRCTWSVTETKFLIQAYKEHYPVLIATASTQGKKIVWENIMTDFVDTLKYEANTKTSKTLAQVKEKWRQLFDKYKVCADHNKSTGTDPKTFDYFDEIHEFMASSEKANPKNIKQTQVTKRNDGGEEGNENAGEVNSEVDPDSDRMNNAAGKRRKETTAPETTPKRKKNNAKTDDAIVDMLNAQQEAIKRSEENDEKMLQALLKSQADAQQRHQDFTLAVLGKLGDIFSSKK